MLQLIADGLVVGSVISLGAVGLTLTYSILRFANFGQGEFLTWGAYLAVSALSLTLAVTGGGVMTPIEPFSFGWQLPVAMVASAALTAALALVLDWALFARLRRTGSAITLVIASFGAALALRNLLQFLYGTLPEYYTREIQIAVRLVPRGALGDVMGGLRITPDQMLVLGVTAAAVIGLHVLLTRTTLGRAMRATAQNPALARVAGVDVEGVVRATWVIGAGMAAVAGVMAGLVGQIRPGLGFELLLPLFAAAILGGIGSVWGAVAGGLIVGLAESFSVPLFGAEYRLATAFLVLIAILLLRPRGLFGEKA
ncbi:branched-chain amino acid ABC transporter permease [Roseomonas stagni]|uniref:Branched-chain amino acid ABC transporter permease n=1 Tax=Falsiroseomonas algicola TaxID=2716930 RepID=A0A6M1LEF3_9PROT|nr:branched-chain amino acid ABC transporter permease [Falsiroseomonas algicola]NGM18665.1 branched-chain amino acid ABC transporter permease [Falsiroseomonas algicola]